MRAYTDALLQFSLLHRPSLSIQYEHDHMASSLSQMPSDIFISTAIFLVSPSRTHRLLVVFCLCSISDKDNSIRDRTLCINRKDDEDYLQTETIKTEKKKERNNDFICRFAII